MIDADSYKELEDSVQKDVVRLAHMTHSVFATDEGQTWLKEISKTTINKTVADPEKSSQWAYFREGQNSVIRSILRLMQYHNTNGGKLDE